MEAIQPCADRPTVLRPLGILSVRIALVGAAAVLGWLALGGPGRGLAFPPPAPIAAVTLLPVNLVCLFLVRRLVHDQGRRLRDLVGYRAGRLLVDIGWGLLWLVVLYVPFVATVLAVMALRYGSGMVAAFGSIFFDPASLPPLSSTVSLALAVVAVITFAPVNAPVEELVYRGYAQQELARSWAPSTAIGVSAVAFGLQHAFFAGTPDAALVYLAAFTVWGLGAGIIVHRQGRLLPMIIAHGVVNLASTSVPAVLIATV